VHIDLAKKQFNAGDLIEVRLEVSNVGREPLLVPNGASFFGGAAEAYLEVELSNDKGPLQPHMVWAVDRVPAEWLPRKSPMEIVINSFLLLPPRTSFAQKIPLSVFLGATKYEVKPGAYKLKCYYSSGGLFYPPAYERLGLTGEDVKSLPFRAWHGKIATNELSFAIVPGR
jgi:hypothetical protein